MKYLVKTKVFYLTANLTEISTKHFDVLTTYLYNKKLMRNLYNVGTFWYVWDHEFIEKSVSSPKAQPRQSLWAGALTWPGSLRPDFLFLNLVLSCSLNAKIKVERTRKVGVKYIKKYCYRNRYDKELQKEDKVKLNLV